MENLIEELIATKKWDRTQILLGIRANYKCEYCDLDLLASPDNYKLWQMDHIIPKYLGRKDVDDFDNKALSCLVCNSKLKVKWNPERSIGEGKSREEKIFAIRDYVKERRFLLEKEIAETKKIFDEVLSKK